MEAASYPGCMVMVMLETGYRVSGDVVAIIILYI